MQHEHFACLTWNLADPLGEARTEHQSGAEKRSANVCIDSAGPGCLLTTSACCLVREASNGNIVGILRLFLAAQDQKCSMNPQQLAYAMRKGSNSVSW